MSSTVDIDPAAVRAAGRELASHGGRLAGGDGIPPEPDWGGDKFGAALRARYPRADNVPDALRSKREIARVLARTGDVVTRTADDHADLEGAIASAIDAIEPEV